MKTRETEKRLSEKHTSRSNRSIARAEKLATERERQLYCYPDTTWTEREGRKSEGRKSCEWKEKRLSLSLYGGYGRKKVKNRMKRSKQDSELV